MTPIGDAATLASEEAVVVLEPLDQFPWLREQGWTSSGPKARPVRKANYRVVAYSTALPRSDGAPHVRRVWFVRDGDRVNYGADDWPIEAVDPASIAPRRASRRAGPRARWAFRRGGSRAGKAP
jgi:hypothetical protein